MASEATETPKVVTDAAEIEDALPMREVTLIGLITSPKGNKALLRESDGDIKTVKPGDRVGRAQVMAIDEKVLILAEDGKARKLTVAEATGTKPRGLFGIR